MDLTLPGQNKPPGMNKLITKNLHQMNRLLCTDSKVENKKENVRESGKKRKIEFNYTAK